MRSFKKVTSILLIIALLSMLCSSCHPLAPVYEPDYAAMVKDYWNSWADKYSEDLTIVHRGDRYKAAMGDVTPLILESSEVYGMAYIEHHWDGDVVAGGSKTWRNPTDIEDKFDMYQLGWGPTSSVLLIVWGDNRSGDVNYYVLRSGEEEIQVELDADYFCNVHEFFFEKGGVTHNAKVYFYAADGTLITYTG